MRDAVGRVRGRWGERKREGGETWGREEMRGNERRGRGEWRLGTKGLRTKMPMCGAYRSKKAAKDRRAWVHLGAAIPFV